MTEYGRSAWTTKGKDNGLTYYAMPNKTLPKDGTIPDGLTAESQQWYVCVNLGVLAIKTLLADEGFLIPEAVDGIFGPRARKAVKLYQEANNIFAGGNVGTTTMTSLLRPVITAEALTKVIDPQWIYALARQESGLDPGAQGWSTPHDRGIWQFNTLVGPETPQTAADILHAADAVSRRWKQSFDKYQGKGADLRIDCSILQHRSPVGADYLYEHGVTLGPESDLYIKNVRAFATQW